MVKKCIILFSLFLLIYVYSDGQNVDSTVFIGNVGTMGDGGRFNGNLKEFIQSKINYPKKAKNELVEGTVYVSFWVDTTGVTIKHKIVKGIRKDLDDEALRVARLIKFERPSILQGKPVLVKYVVPINFELKNIRDTVSDEK